MTSAYGAGMDSHSRPSTALDLIRRPDRLTLGIKLSLDNEWSPEGEARRIADGRPYGVPRRFGARIGRKLFLDHLNELYGAGVDHLAVLLRPSRRLLPEVIDELAREVLPDLAHGALPAPSPENTTPERCGRHGRNLT